MNPATSAIEDVHSATAGGLLLWTQGQWWEVCGGRLELVQMRGEARPNSLCWTGNYWASKALRKHDCRFNWGRDGLIWDNRCKQTQLRRFDWIQLHTSSSRGVWLVAAASSPAAAAVVLVAAAVVLVAAAVVLVAAAAAVLCCAVLYRAMLGCDKVWCGEVCRAVLCCTTSMLCSAMLWSAALRWLYCAVLLCIVLCCSVLCCAELWY